MTESSLETKKKILESAKKEFLEKGFLNASLRTIAANAGLTTGAMYRHFKDKDDLFRVLVEDAVDVTTKAVMEAGVPAHIGRGKPFTKESAEIENQVVMNFLDYIYSNFDVFTLLISKSGGSTLETFVEEMRDLYTKNCTETFNWLYEEKYAAKKLDAMTIHATSASMINAFTELITHNVPKKQAVTYVKNILEYCHFGLSHLLGL
ncbi:MAG: TetR/AcrR family transcriptional regulator [Treponema sp.]|nr:TetR/AcrR family transcriptional regulator [Treponema sp.]